MAIGEAGVISSQICGIVLATGSLQEVGRFILEWAWDIWWALVLGFTISGAIQAYVSQERMVELLGGRGGREIGLGAFFGFLSSSCSFAAIATTRTIFKKGASPEASLAAFQFASTNLVIEIGLVMWILIGWQFVIADFLGGVFLILLFAVITKYLVPDSWFESARDHPDETGGGMQMDTILSLLLRAPKQLLSTRSSTTTSESSRGEHEHALTQNTTRCNRNLAGSMRFVGRFTNGRWSGATSSSDSSLPVSSPRMFHNRRGPSCSRSPHKERLPG